MLYVIQEEEVSQDCHLETVDIYMKKARKTRQILKKLKENYGKYISDKQLKEVILDIEALRSGNYQVIDDNRK